jgi:NCAIR mutase (PurE)-related protein
MGVAYAELGHTKLDLHRLARRGVAETVYCAGKTADEILAIVQRLDAAGQPILCTRIEPDAARRVMRSVSRLKHHARARVLYRPPAEPPASNGSILVLSAGTTDIPVAEEAAICAEVMGNCVERVFDVGVAGIHRLFGAAAEKMLSARVIIVVAGMEGALPSVVAGLVTVPVIAVPTSVGYGASFGGISALLTMLNSCSGGVAVVNIDNGFGAALLAHLIVNALPQAAPNDSPSRAQRRRQPPK